MNSSSKKLVQRIEDLQGLGPVSLERLYQKDITRLAQIATIDLTVFREITGLTEAACKKILNQANQSYVFKVDTARELVLKQEKMNYCQVGSLALNKLLGGGLEEGATTEFYGAFGSGKTQVVFSSIACFLINENYADKKVLLIDTENTFRSERLRQVLILKGKTIEESLLLLQRVVVFKPRTVPQQMIILSRLNMEEEINTSSTGILKAEEIKYLAIDSIMSLYRSSYMGRGTLQERQQKLNSHLADLGVIVEKHTMFCIITNQVCASPDPYSPVMVPVGGNIMAHASTHRIKLKRFNDGIRSARMIDSPGLAEEEVKFKVDQFGVRD